MEDKEIAVGKADMITKPVHTLDHIRKSFNESTNRTSRAQIGQFLTPSTIARFMSSMCETFPQEVRILDPGAGAGVLFASLVDTLISRKNRPLSIEVVAYETDSAILPFLEETLKRCEALCISKGIRFQGIIKHEDFVSDAIAETRDSLFATPGRRFTHIILNPPYKKINTQTAMGKRLYAAGLEVANIYAAFVWLSARLLEPGGEIVAITPRSFCNGPYFKKFRVAFLKMVNLTGIHVFASRKKAFGDDDVLQENIIYHAVRGLRKAKTVVISTSDGLEFEKGHTLSVPYGRVVHHGDPDMFIHVGLDAADLGLAERMRCFTSSLGKLGLTVSTGRVVDFRAREHLRESTEQGTVPLIYPYHFQYGFINWPIESEKNRAPSCRRRRRPIFSSRRDSMCSRKGSRRRSSRGGSWRLSMTPQGSMHTS
jgi:adenine-specific DNA-methyltransferase